ncbi:MAG: helix-turn-helix domain-containing protein [Syntrophobacteraceae bacterium]
MVKKIFGKRLQAIRILKGLDLSELAHRAGLSQQTLRRYEGGKSLPRGDTVFKLACALDTSVSNLMDINLMIKWLDRETRKALYEGSIVTRADAAETGKVLGRHVMEMRPCR